MKKKTDTQGSDVDVETTVNLSDLDSFETRTMARREEATGERLRVAKAYKMYVGGAFVRSESGRYLQVKAGDEKGADPGVVNVPRGSRKDARDAVLVAKSALDGWSARTAYNRGQILYRLAEVMESRHQELVTSLVRGGQSEAEASGEVDAAIDRAIFYAGFCDKYQSLLASSNPVSGPHFGFSVPEPMGVVAVIAPESPALLGLVSTVLPVIATGNTVIALASEKDPRTAIVFCECLATSDLPGGVANVLTGRATEMAPHEALEREGADNVKRVKTHAVPAAPFWLDDRRGQGIGWLERFLETKSVWHPVGV